MATLLLGFDVERIPGLNPPDDFSRRLLGYVVDESLTLGFLQALQRLLAEEAAVATLFIAGMNAECFPEAYRVLADDPHFDLQQHAYSHEPFKCIAEERDDEMQTRVFRPCLPSQAVFEDLLRGEQAVTSAVGCRPVGLTAPFAYWRGLGDQPLVLETLWDLGYRFVRSYGRTPTDYQPLPVDQAQPFRYELQGFSGLMEIPITGWHDVGFKTRFGWEEVARFADYVCGELDRLAGTDLVWSLLQHDWSSVQYDENLTVTRSILRRARALGWQVLSHTEFYSTHLDSVGGYRTGLVSSF